MFLLAFFITSSFPDGVVQSTLHPVINIFVETQVEYYIVCHILPPVKQYKREQFFPIVSFQTLP